MINFLSNRCIQDASMNLLFNWRENVSAVSNAIRFVLITLIRGGLGVKEPRRLIRSPHYECYGLQDFNYLRVPNSADF